MSFTFDQMRGAEVSMYEHERHRNAPVEFRIKLNAFYHAVKQSSYRNVCNACSIRIYIGWEPDSEVVGQSSVGEHEMKPVGLRINW